MDKKLDYTRILKTLYSASLKTPEIIDVPPMYYLLIDGKGNPNNSPTYQEAVSALYTLAYALKFTIKKTQAIEYKVLPLEGLWWVDDMSLFSVNDKDNWQWTMMIMQPDMITEAIFSEVYSSVIKSKKIPLHLNIRFEPYHEGCSAQIMHLGPYSEEKPTIERLHAYAHNNGYHLDGKHNEIYLGNPQKTTPQRLKTIIRQPVQKIAPGLFRNRYCL